MTRTMQWGVNNNEEGPVITGVITRVRDMGQVIVWLGLMRDTV